ncbi:PD-(D/E)XK nuclease superfamily protein [Spirosoma oryzae]|uniref:PD-(D/E)XK nuclease superfamily protein n=1 Tax=Spirosoma oryzae TaxID=1469603 RepID=A0A2T0SRB1_9BACT|nr:PD-(D/E)XK nuclease family protein [Spirosoma oryzae]PRY35955.1 PD-(D/E)XK nuclease superfamily protein [Spirosoma oryzae]
MTFLQQAAQRIYEYHGASMRDVWVILPTRRAVSVFLGELAQCSDRPFLAPRALAVDDFIAQAADRQQIDSVSLLFDLFDVFREIDPTVEFEQFVGWAPVLLTDFDRIDQYLIPATQLFDNMTAVKRLEAWNLELPKGAATITETEGTKRYFELFDNLAKAYNELRKRLDSQGLAYRGMAYRRLAENVGTLIRDNTAYERLWFVGFNALSAAEERIIEVLSKAGKAALIWDADNYYVDDRLQEAGTFLRKYRNNSLLFSRENHDDLNQPSQLLTTPKTMRVVGVPNASMQTKVAGKLYQDWQRDDAVPGAAAQKTAIILADETLLVPTLYALDESVTNLNVTMGLSLRSSLLFTLIDTLFEMQRTVHEFRARDGRHLKIPKFHHRHVVKVLNHPFVKQYERIHQCMWPGGIGHRGEELPPEPLFQWMAKDIVQNQRVYLTRDDMLELSNNEPLIDLLFNRWKDDRPGRVILVFYDLIDKLREVYRTSQDAIEIEYLYLFHTLLRQLETTLRRQAELRKADRQASPVTVKSFRTFLYELIRQTSIPFTSEGNSTLQVMGMLETRGLDFDRVIILSVNEGILPKARKMNSLIPFDIAQEIGLPTYREQESVMAYHFYRLLQRAREIVLIHTTSTDAYGSSKGEPSRYIRQIKHELIPANKLITLTEPTVRFGRESDAKLAEKQVMSVPKTAEITDRIRSMLTHKGLYPSQLNQFVSCSMRFYFSRIVNISEEDDIEERMGAADFGNWLHKVLERLDLDYRLKGQPVSEPIIRSLLEEEFANSMKGRVVESGMNLLLYDMARQLMLDFQRQQNSLPDLTVIGTEQTLRTKLRVSMGEGREPLEVTIAGKIDRIERFGDRIRIVDYKTGKVDLNSKIGPEQLREKLLSDGGQEKMRQLWLYRYLALKTIQEKGGLPRSETNGDIYPAVGMPVEAGFYSFRDVNGGFKTNPVQFGDGQSVADYIAESEELLGELIRAMLDPDEPFKRTDQLATCEYCDFKGICGR